MLQKLPAPRHLRDVIELFTLYDPAQGIDSVLKSFDPRGLTRADVLGAVLGETDVKPMAVMQDESYRPWAHFRNLLKGDEFRRRARQLILQAYPEKQRIIFVHVPKCAGTDLSFLLKRRYPVLADDQFMPEVTPVEKFFAQLRDFSIGCRYSDSIVLLGHTYLSLYRQQKISRDGDFLFTILRDPVEIVYSFINFVLGVCQRASATPVGHEIGWLKFLEISAFPQNPTLDEILILARRALYKDNAVDTMCKWLGNGDAESTIANLIASDIEITDIAHYPAWRELRFPRSPVTRHNQSTWLFTPELASPADRAHIDKVTAQDQILYRRVQGCWQRSGGLSIRGSALK